PGSLTTSAVTSSQTVTVGASYTSGGVTRSAPSQTLTLTAASTPGGSGTKSINSTSMNRATPPTAPVAEQPLTTLSGYQILSVNDLGMHCGDLDHRVASILPPFNVLHSIVIQKGTTSFSPEILTPTDLQVVYSASSNPNDPALQNPVGASIFKTNFWEANPAQAGETLAFGGYDPFYPPSILSAFTVTVDMGLPVPDIAALYPTVGTGQLLADQQLMPGTSAPYSANVPQAFKRFDTDLPFFTSFPFGYRLTNMNWFAADGIPVAPFDDFGRKNSYPLMRVQAKTINTGLTGKSGDVVASVDSVVPVSAESDCYRCHVSAADGGMGYAACVQGVDANCTQTGSPRSNTLFVVARPSEDTANVPADAKREWAADNNIIRLHDAKHGTNLQSSTPVVCQKCHYTPALDLAHVGPKGPNDADANGREQKIHRSNSNVMHSFHAQFTDLFKNDMPPPSDSRRLDPATGKPVINAFVIDKLNQSCYQCHPGQNTKCLRGAMFNGGLICNDCHGGMQQLGNDFSKNFPTTAFPAGADLTKRVPWANEPKCQSCHTGDATSNLALTDPNVIKAKDGIRLLQAFRTNDTANAKPIVATNKRFAENDSGSNTVLYRLSKGHSGIFCEACHGSTHAEWPVLPESGTSVGNDNMTAIQAQGHTGKIIECTTCHTAGSLPVSLGGPHGMHPVGDSRFMSGHESLAEGNLNACKTCHGQTGQGTVLSKVAANRTVGSRSFTKGELVACNRCHGNPM
ncbi:MAG: cytochrome C, partial [Acidobacteriota bacterium]